MVKKIEHQKNKYLKNLNLWGKFIYLIIYSLLKKKTNNDFMNCYLFVIFFISTSFFFFTIFLLYEKYTSIKYLNSYGIFTRKYINYFINVEYH